LNEIMEEYILEGLAGLARLQDGKHLRPAQLAQTIVAIVAAPEAAQDVVLQPRQLALEEVPDGTP